MDLELRSLRVFCQVMRDGSFSAAARSLRITQPAVSQQIARLESEYGARLFERLGHDIVPTPAARQLEEFASHLIERVDEFSESVLEDRRAPRGTVSYAMPETCQWTPHFRRIMSQIREFPELRFEIDILPSAQIVQGLLEARYDFGFIVGERLAPELRFEKFSDERYSWVASSRELLALPEGGRTAPRLVSYPGWELFFTTWCKFHRLWDGLKPRLREPTVRIGTLAGAIHAVLEGAGAAVIPTHCVAEELASGQLLELKPSRDRVASNPVYLARRVGARLPRRAEVVIELLRTAKQTLG
jgi:DNA-binding transcriptional LysR family regulator